MCSGSPRPPGVTLMTSSECSEVAKRMSTKQRDRRVLYTTLCPPPLPRVTDEALRSQPASVLTRHRGACGAMLVNVRVGTVPVRSVQYSTWFSKPSLHDWDASLFNRMASSQVFERQHSTQNKGSPAMRPTRDRPGLRGRTTEQLSRDSKE